MPKAEVSSIFEGRIEKVEEVALSPGIGASSPGSSCNGIGGIMEADFSAAGAYVADFELELGNRSTSALEPGLLEGAIEAGLFC
jgi:hypothetical protein